jgi:hypothetical protein
MQRELSEQATVNAGGSIRAHSALEMGNIPNVNVS